MENIIQKITQQYSAEVAHIKTVGRAELSISLKKEVNPADFAQKLQDNLLAIIDDLSIVKINVIDANGSLTGSFSSNQ